MPGDGGKRSIHLRLEPAIHDRLQQLGERSGGTVTELARTLVERGLDDEPATALVVGIKSIEQRVAELGRAFDRRADALEQLACTLDANAARRQGMLDEKLSRLLAATQRQLLSARELTAAVFESLLPAAGLSVEATDARAEACRAATAEQHAEYKANVARMHAEVDARAPAALTPPPHPADGNGTMLPATTNGSGDASPADPAQLSLPVEEA